VSHKSVALTKKKSDYAYRQRNTTLGKRTVSPSPENATIPLSSAVALVTGGNRGIGRAIALRLASMGAAVALCGRNSAALQSVAAELQQRTVRVFSLVADITRSADVASLVDKTQAALGPISILVNNAGIGMFGPVHEKSEADFDKTLDTNLKGVFLVSRAVVPHMIRRGGGDIVNISSLAGKNVFAGGGLYCASKWALQGLSGCMAEELREHGIRVSVVCPGSVFTEFAGRGPKDPTKVLMANDVAHAVAMIVTQGPQSFLSEVHLRPVTKG
jgi:NAD(P)-dependent dehydrogenase (short-subunit alcohol dehydrogenase family)